MESQKHKLLETYQTGIKLLGETKARLDFELHSKTFTGTKQEEGPVIMGLLQVDHDIREIRSICRVMDKLLSHSLPDYQLWVFRRNLLWDETLELKLKVKELLPPQQFTTTETLLKGALHTTKQPLMMVLLILIFIAFFLLVIRFGS